MNKSYYDLGQSMLRDDDPGYAQHLLNRYDRGNVDIFSNEFLLQKRLDPSLDAQEEQQDHCHGLGLGVGIPTVIFSANKKSKGKIYIFLKSYWPMKYFVSPSSIFVCSTLPSFYWSGPHAKQLFFPSCTFFCRNTSFSQFSYVASFDSNIVSLADNMSRVHELICSIRGTPYDS